MLQRAHPKPDKTLGMAFNDFEQIKSKQKKLAPIGSVPWRASTHYHRAMSHSPAPQHGGFVPGRHLIESFGSHGFRFADMSHRGSILALPSGVRAWAAAAPADITADALAPLFAEPAGAVELLIVGTGAELVRLAPALRDQLRAAKIRFDPMATAAAIATYNILLGERRRVAAAFLAVP